MKTKDLLSQLSRMEQTLHDFSFEELTSVEAKQLKRTFEAFKINLENKIFQPSNSAGFSESDEFTKESKSIEKNRVQEKDPNMLIARVSHEIRTPLNGIIGFTDLLKEDDGLNKQQFERVNAIQKASYSLMEIINELLEYSKLSAGIEVFESVEFNFRNVIGDVIYLCKTLVSEKKVVLNVSIDEDVPSVLCGDPSKLTQVLLNLLGNAIKFVEEGSIDLSIEVKSNSNNRASLKFSIADTGIGIAQENLTHIFDTFKQANTATFSKYGGSGLGLSIVKQIIGRLGGSIEVRSELGKGTTFDIEIPYELGSTQNSDKKGHCKIVTTENTSELVSGMRVLIFEDNILNQKLIEQRLKAWKCKTYITDNAQYGLNILAHHKIDLILMDLKMPNMNGFEITKLIRTFERHEAQLIPIIALSADFSVQDKELCDEYGIDDFILKPYSTEELLQKLIKNKRTMNQTISTTSKFSESKSTENVVNKIDLSCMLEECMGQIDLLQELVRLYKQNALEFIGNILIHLQNSDSKQIAFDAHKIKSGLKLMQTNGLLSIVEQIQDCCNSEPDMKRIQGLYERFLVEYPRIEKEIDIAMDELRKTEG